MNVNSIHFEPVGEVGGGFPEGAQGSWSRSTAGWDNLGGTASAAAISAVSG